MFSFVWKIHVDDDKVRFRVTQLDVNSTTQILTAKHIHGTITRLTQWKKDVETELTKNNIKIYKWAVVHVGLNAEQLKSQLEQEFKELGKVFILQLLLLDFTFFQIGNKTIILPFYQTLY